MGNKEKAFYINVNIVRVVTKRDALNCHYRMTFDSKEWLILSCYSWPIRDFQWIWGLRLIDRRVAVTL